MRDLSITFRLLWKDVRYQWGWLIGVWVLAWTIPYLEAAIATGKHLTTGSVSWELRPSDTTEPIYWLIAFCALVLARAVLLDAPAQRLNYLSTRPVPWKAAALSKVIFFVVFLLIPICFVKMKVLWLLHIPVNGPDMALLLFEFAAFVGSYLAVMFLVSLYAVNIYWAIAFSCIAWFIIAYAKSFSGTILDYYDFGPDPRLPSTRELIAQICFLTTVLVVTAMRFRRDRVAPAICVLLVGLTAGLGILDCWPASIVIAEAHGPVAEQMRAWNLRYEPHTNERKALFGSVATQTAVSFYGLGRTSVGYEATLAGMKDPYTALLIDYHATAILKSGHTIPSNYSDTQDHGERGGIDDLLLARMSGLPDKEHRYPAGYVNLDIFNYVHGAYAKEDLTHVRISGTMTLQMICVDMIKSMALKEGGIVGLPRRRIEVTRLTTDWAGAEFELRALEAPSTLRGDMTGNFELGDMAWLVFSPVLGEYLEESSRGGDHTRDNALFHDGLVSTTYRRANGFGNPFPKGWEEHAVINFFRPVMCGVVKVPYEVDDVDLER